MFVWGVCGSDRAINGKLTSIITLEGSVYRKLLVVCPIELRHLTWHAEMKTFCKFRQTAKPVKL
jgi:hypothetical protein